MWFRRDGLAILTAFTWFVEGQRELGRWGSDHNSFVRGD